MTMPGIEGSGNNYWTPGTIGMMSEGQNETTVRSLVKNYLDPKQYNMAKVQLAITQFFTNDSDKKITDSTEAQNLAFAIADTNDIVVDEIKEETVEYKKLDTEF